MAPHDRRTDDALDALLDGATSTAPSDSLVGVYLAELRTEAAASPAAPAGILTSVLEDGLVAADAAAKGILTFSSKPVDQGILTASTNNGALTRGILTASTDAGILTRGILTMRTKGRTIGRVLVTKFAALGLLSKAAVAGATMTVAASSAGAAGVLPPPAQVAFDDAVGRQVATADEGTEEPTEGETSDVDFRGDKEQGVDGGTVSEQARLDDDTPGVDGRSVADDAAGDAPEQGQATAEERSEGRVADAGAPADQAGAPADVDDEPPVRPQPQPRNQD